MISKLIRFVIKGKIKRLNKERDMILGDMERFSLPRMTSDPPQITYGFMMENLALKICEMKICIFEEILRSRI